MNILGSLTQLILLIVLLVNTTLTFVVYRNNPKSATNRSYVGLSLVMSLWIVASFFSVNPETNLFWARLTIFFATLISMFFFVFTYTVPAPNFGLRKYIIVPMLFSTLGVMGITLTPLVFEGTQIINQKPELIVRPGIAAFAFLTTFFTITAVVLLILKIRRSSSEKKKQLLLILWGILSMVGMIIVTVMIPVALFQNDFFVAFIPIYTLLFLGMTAYAIVKYHLFDIKIIVTEALTFIIWITLLSKTFISPSSTEKVMDMFILVATIFFGILLIRSVRKEVEQREEIAKMAEDVRRAYVIEKKAKEELEVLDKIKDQFVMTTQHNLRTPLTSMMGYTDLLLQGAFGKQNKKTTEVIKRFQTSTQNLIKMVNNFLDMAQFQLGKSVVVLKSGVDVVSCVDEIVNDLAFKAENKGIKLNFDKPKKEIKIKADREKLKAALFNVIDNAVKYTIEGEVNVRVELKSEIRNSKFETNSNDQNSKPSVLVTVKDSGIGIAKDKLGSIFEQMFERSEEAKKIASVGSGVGLYLSGEIVKSHNGRAWAESQGEGKGSTFFVELPLDDGKPVPPPSQPAPGQTPPAFTRATNKDITPASFVKAATPSQPISKN